MSGRLARLIRAVLTHPGAMWIKARMRDVAWRRLGAGVANPPLPDRVSSAVFVCLGNICRSPFAAHLAAQRFAAAGRADVVCTSAGIHPKQADRSPDAARAAAREYGLSLDDHRPQALTREMVASHDVVIVMEASQWHQLRVAYPAFHDRILLLSLYDGAARGAYERCNIADPFGQPVAAFAACYTRVARALDGLLAELGRSAARGRSALRSA